MTYITYESAQYSDYKNPRWISTFGTGIFTGKMTPRLEQLHRYSQPPKKIPLILPKPEFMPSRLVRISDMKVVKGSDVNEGYCALSYSWNQSGDMMQNEVTGKSERYDQGKHRIIFPARIIRKKPRGRKRIPRKVKFVKFEGIIQQICRDFNIKYMWFDQMCINQDDRQERQKEIKQMHKIYSNAYCTIASVPELETCPFKSPDGERFFGYTIDPYSILESQWIKRLWTLEETILSSRIIFIGRKGHVWWYRINEYDFPIFQRYAQWDVITVLHYAHARTSTKEHDRVFALASIFPDVMKKINIDYSQDIQELIVQFYGILAKKDISILCFGSHNNYKKMCKKSIIDSNINSRNEDDVKEYYEVPIQKFQLPSWTGVHGEHDQRGSLKTSFQNYTIYGRTMKVTSCAITNDQYIPNDPALILNPNDIPDFPQEQKQQNVTTSWVLSILIELKGDKSNSRYVSLCDDTYSWKFPITDSFCQNITKKLQEFSHFMPIQSRKNLKWMPYDDAAIKRLYFSGLAERLQDSDQYVMLSGIQFEDTEDDYILCPVIKKNQDTDYYKAIGSCIIEQSDYLSNIGYTHEEQAFKIQ